MINYIDSEISECYLGNNKLDSVYLGSTKLWPTHDYSQDYFTIESLHNNNIIGFQRSGSNVTGYIADIRYSTDGNTWYLINADDNGGFITLNVGDKIYIKPGEIYNIVTKSAYPHFSSTYDVNVYGNVNSVRDPNFKTNHIMIDQTHFYYRLFNGLKIVDASNLVFPYTTIGKYCYVYMFDGCSSLITAPKLPATTLADYCYYGMFRNCTSLVAVPVLPATILQPRCYQYMFYGCTSLTTAPELPATTLAAYCYAYMFEGCSSLITAPELPATTLANSCYMSMFAVTKITSAPELPATTLTDSCYRNMFYGCTSLRYPPTLNATILQPRCYQHMFFGCNSLKTAPELPATTLATYCYAYMFQNCTLLSYIKCLATNISASNSHDYWLYNVSPTGTFTKKASMTLFPEGANGIPSGWTVVNV